MPKGQGSRAVVALRPDATGEPDQESGSSRGIFLWKMHPQCRLKTLYRQCWSGTQRLTATRGEPATFATESMTIIQGDKNVSLPNKEITKL